MIQRIAVLGATGSIGVSTLDVLRLHPEKFSVFALTAHSQYQLLAEQCCEFNPDYAVIGTEACAKVLQALLVDAGCTTKVLVGEASLVDVASATEVDVVMAAIVGAAGLASTMAAVCAGKKILLANKESLVMSGKLFMCAAQKHGAVILPIDSEHNAIFQSLPLGFSSLKEAGVSKLLLTGSGGPFRQLPLAEFSSVTPERACNHPNWSMGRKISVDSATMMNKGLEFIEACWMFHALPNDIDVLIHPQSIVHSMVQYIDGSVIAQMGRPDMRTPIAHALAWPQRMNSSVESLNFLELSELTFEAPDSERFPCLRLAREALTQGGELSAVLNATNEIAVESFLAGKIMFSQIPLINQKIMESWNNREPESLADVIEADRKARSQAKEWVAAQC